MIIRQPMRRHFKSRFSMLRARRICEVEATDTYFMPVKSLEGFWCAQMFVGCTSHRKKVYGMKTESEFPNVYRDHLRQDGIPHTLRRDNARSENSEAIKAIHRELIIADEFSEPHNQQQNPAENLGVKSVKERGAVIMDRTNSPANTWFPNKQVDAS